MGFQVGGDDSKRRIDGAEGMEDVHRLSKPRDPGVGQRRRGDRRVGFPCDGWEWNHLGWLPNDGSENVD